MNDNNVFTSTYGYKLIYIFRINDNTHKNILKIGDATIHTEKSIDELLDNCVELQIAARNRIDQYTKTAGIVYELLYTTIAINNQNKAFRDHLVHEVLKRSGIKTKYLNGTNRNEWYITDLQTAKNAIIACKEGRAYINSNEKSKKNNPIILRPEQKEAVEKTIKNFKTSNRMLWNAKMRFGKTICALEIVKRQQYKRTIILTHRPVVDDGWFDDFNKIFYEESNYKYGSKNKGERIENLIKSDCNFVYFASIQDLRGSKEVGGRYQKNEIVFNINWDLVVIDEAHEGTKTNIGEKTIEGVVKITDAYPTKLLELSGTPFNLLADYEESQIYTWDYVMEQSAKLEWETKHDGDYNPYEDLPQMNIFTYDLNKFFKGYVDVGDKSFNFREFFKTWTGNTEIDRREMPKDAKIGRFIHEEDVKRFLDLLTREDEKTNYPYSREKYRDYFRHSLWMVPGVKEAKALSTLLNEHDVFGSGIFKIVNVAGDGDEEDTLNAKEKVDTAITKHPEDTYTITLSCGRLTTGVSIPAWTSVFMLAGSNSTSASSYLQTIFRVQTPANIGGKMKDKCYVFDFAPDRTLKMMAEAGQLSCKPGSIESKTKMGDLLNFCPVIAIDGSRMIPYNVDKMLQTLKKAYADRVVRNGFDDTKIYNDKLLKLDGIELEDFERLQKIIGTSKQTNKIKEIDINNQGFTDEEYEEYEKIKNKPKKELSEEQKARLEEYKKQKDQASKAMSILRGISIRIPLLIYGAEIKDNEEVTVDNFTDIIDDFSWKEFMPKGITKELFKHFSKYYDEDIFVEAGNRIRNIAKYADTLSPVERTKEIANLFSTFKNPDKETVLTPWRTVNMHMGDCIGGYNFYDQQYIMTIEEPRLILNGEVTNEVLNNDNSKVLEINSKSGLYPLYITYSIFRQRCLDCDAKKLNEELEKALWKATLEENIFVVCKTQMASSITKRTLAGYNEFKTNIMCYENMLDDFSKESDDFKQKILDPLEWGRKDSGKMKFNAIVGNPPYQENLGNNGGNASLSKQLFPMFITNTIKLNPHYISLVTPSKWFSAKAQDGSFIKLREYVKNNNHFVKIFNYMDNKDLFPNVYIGSVNYYLFDSSYNGDVEFTEINGNIRNSITRPLFEDGLDIILPMNSLISILKKVKDREDFTTLMNLTCGRDAFGLEGKNINSISQSEPFNDSIEVRCAYEEKRYVSKNKIKKNIELLNSWKIFTSKGNGGAGLLFDDKEVAIIGKAYIGGPKTACTDSLIPIGNFKTEIEAINLQKYMKTKFLRFMVGILKVSQNIYQIVYQFVPIQDFTNDSDIDWSKSIKEIDIQLYKKYNLSSDEINYIESKIVSME